MYDTIVIGAGLGGLMAAIAQAEQGARVMLLAKGHGTTHWTSGCIDLLDSSAPDLATALDQLAVEHPSHPYAIIGDDAIVAALERLRAICEAAGYPLAGSLGRNVLLPTPLGALRPTCLVPATMVAGDSRQLPRDGAGGGKLLIAGFHELRDFFPPVIAANLRAQGYAADGVYLEMPDTERHLDFGTFHVARLFDRPAFRANVGRQLHALVHRGGYGRVALPAVLGIKHPLEVVSDLQAQIGALVFEIPTLPASVPGIRLYNILESALIAAGGRVQLGSRVLRGEGKGGRLAAIYSEAAAREQRHEAGRYVLASGGIIGGGLRADESGHLRETALDLPVCAPAARADWLEPRFLAEKGHAIFRAGVAVDKQLRPLDAAGAVVYDNVAVTGATISGSDPIREGCMEGMAVSTGWYAGAMKKEK